MKTHKLVLTTTFVVSAAACLVVAQENRPNNRPQVPGSRPTQGQQSPSQPGQSSNSNRQGGPGEGGPAAQGGSGMQRPSFPLIEALDANRNNEIDASEISNAAAALKKLDKNGDGKLSREEFLPQRPGGFGGPGSSAPGADQGRPSGTRQGPPSNPSGASQPNSSQRQRPPSE